MKLNYVGLAAAILAIASLALPWFNVSMTGIGENNEMVFNAYLYQIQGTVNGVSATAFPAVWFIYIALALIAITVVCCAAGSFLAGRRGQVLLLLAGILALMSMVAFGGGLLNSNFAVTDAEPAAVMNLFPSAAFPITADAAMEDSYHFTWWLSYGFWLVIVAAIVAFVGAVVPSLSKKSVATRTA